MTARFTLVRKHPVAVAAIAGAGLLLLALWLNSSPTAAVEHWITVWNQTDPEQQRQAEMGIREMGSEAARVMAQWLRMSDKRADDPYARMAINRFFVVLGNKAAPATPALAETLRYDPLTTLDDQERFRFVLSLLSWTGPAGGDVIDTIFASMRKPQAACVLSHASSTLASIIESGAPEGVERVVGFLSDTNFVVRVTAAVALSLATTPSESVTRIVGEALQGADPVMTSHTLVFMPQFRGNNEIYLTSLAQLSTNATLEIRGLATKALGRVGGPAFPYIERLLRSDEPTIHARGAAALFHYAAKVGTPGWGDVKPLMQALLQETNVSPVISGLDIAAHFPELVAQSPELISRLRTLATNRNWRILRSARNAVKLVNQVNSRAGKPPDAPGQSR